MQASPNEPMLRNLYNGTSHMWGKVWQCEITCHRVPYHEIASVLLMESRSLLLPLPLPLLVCVLADSRHHLDSKSSSRAAVCVTHSLNRKHRPESCQARTK